MEWELEPLMDLAGDKGCGVKGANRETESSPTPTVDEPPHAQEARSSYARRPWDELLGRMRRAHRR